jgi:hypothetical protein
MVFATIPQTSYRSEPDGVIARMVKSLTFVAGDWRTRLFGSMKASLDLIAFEPTRRDFGQQHVLD